MKAVVENYKGIEFVRISSLPEDQKKMIWSSFQTQKIIKILRNKELMNDCVKYEDYSEWYRLYCNAAVNTVVSTPLRAKDLKLAFK